MREVIKQSILIYLVLTIVTGAAYPLAVTAIAQLVWPDKANGSLVVDEKSGKVIGSKLLGQEFTSPKYFWGRPSATTPAYNAGASSGSNLGPTNPKLVENTKARIDALRAGTTDTTPIPVDLVTSSGSGLDPDISIAAANYQIDRICKERGLDRGSVEALVTRSTEQKQLAVLGESRINVLKLNRALDKLDQHQASPE